MIIGIIIIVITIIIRSNSYLSKYTYLRVRWYYYTTYAIPPSACSINTVNTYIHTCILHSNQVEKTKHPRPVFILYCFFTYVILLSTSRFLLSYEDCSWIGWHFAFLWIQLNRKIEPDFWCYLPSLNNRVCSSILRKHRSKCNLILQPFLQLQHPLLLLPFRLQLQLLLLLLERQQPLLVLLVQLQIWMRFH